MGEKDDFARYAMDHGIEPDLVMPQDLDIDLDILHEQHESELEEERYQEFLRQCLLFRPGSAVWTCEDCGTLFDDQRKHYRKFHQKLDG